MVASFRPPVLPFEVRFRIRASSATRLVEASIPVPSEVFLEQDGAAVASYAGEKLVRFERLEYFLRVHALGLEDLELIDRSSR